MPKVRAHLFISGQVQGVFFRDSMRSMAISYGATGWTRNTFDGRVEAVFEGAAEDVNRLIEWCRMGPPAAQVESVEVEWEKFVGEFPGFFIRR